MFVSRYVCMYVCMYVFMCIYVICEYVITERHIVIAKAMQQNGTKYPEAARISAKP